MKALLYDKTRSERLKKAGKITEDIFYSALFAS